MTLDPKPTAAALRRLARQRGRRPDPAPLRRGPCADSFCTASCDLDICRPPAAGPSRRHVTIGEPLIAQRMEDALRLVLRFPPRTKKNGTTLGIKQTAAYRRYRDAIVQLLEPLAPVLGLPLPAQPYNIAATYYVDRRGEPADKVGLDQGLYDTLENAGVVTDDWQFRQADGTRIVCGDPEPRVEVLITPLPTT